MNVRCPACSKITRMPESEAGFPVVCVACGARYTVPRLRAVANTDPDSGGGASSEVGQRRSIWFRAAMVILLTLIGVGVVVGAVLTGRALSDARHPPVASVAARAGHASAPDPMQPTSAPVGRAIKVSSPYATSQLPPPSSLLDLPRVRLRPASTTGALPASRSTTQVAQSASTTQPRAMVSSNSRAAPAARRPPIAPIQIRSTDLTDARIGESIKRGVDYLLGQFDPRSGLLESVATNPDSLAMGHDVLCVYCFACCRPGRRSTIHASTPRNR